MMDRLNGLIFSEILADNAGGSAIDTDGDGRTNKADEYIELQNTTGRPLSLEGFEVWSQQNGRLFAFDDDAVVAPRETATIVGNYSEDLPDGFYDAGMRENGNFLEDGENSRFDALFLVNTNTGEYIVLNYGDPPRTPQTPDGFPGTQQVGEGETVVSNSPNGVAISRNSDGEFEETAPTPGESPVVCFTEGSLIHTPQGQTRVQWLRPGHDVCTRDRGPQTLRAVRRMARNDGDAPILFPAGLLGNDRSLRLSPAHRILLRSPVAELLTGNAEVLVPARHFLGHSGVRRCHISYTYIHLLFDHHEILRANAVETESLFMGDLALTAARSTQGWRHQEGFDLSGITHHQTARPVLKAHEARIVLADMFGVPSVASRMQANGALIC